MMRMHYLLLFCLVALGLFSSCSSDRLDISVPSTQVSISYSRLDLDLGSAKSQKEISEVNKHYLDCCPDMYTFYVRGCLQTGNPEDSLIAEALMQFVQDEYMKKVNQGLRDGFPNLQDNQDRIDNAFRYLKHYFPSGKQPERILFYNSAFTNSVVSSDREIGVGLERYLGKEHPVIKDLPEQYFYQYIKEKMDVRYLERDIIMSWISANYLGEIDEQGTVAEQLIAWGKLVYLTEASLPKLDKSTLLRYTESEYEWAEKNEEAFWKFLIEENVLFKREHKFARNIFQEGPFTPGLPIEEKSSPRLGIYLGWKIVKNYMNNTPETSVHDLLDTDYKQILRTYTGK